MYRVITSTTKEEHFETPTAAAFGMMAYCGSAQPMSTPTINSSAQPSMRIVPRNTTGTVTVPPVIPPTSNVTDSVINWEYFGSYDAYGDLYVYGNIYSYGDVVVEGQITGLGSTTKCSYLDVDPTKNQWEGEPGELAIGQKFMYYCTEKDTWIRWPIQLAW